MGPAPRDLHLKGLCSWVVSTPLTSPSTIHLRAGFARYNTADAHVELEFHNEFRIWFQQGVMAHTCNRSSWEVEADGQPGLRSMLL